MMKCFTPVQGDGTMPNEISAGNRRFARKKLYGLIQYDFVLNLSPARRFQLLLVPKGFPEITLLCCITGDLSAAGSFW